MTEPEIHGLCPPQFEAVRETFLENFAARDEVGARFSIAIEGEVLVDIWAGHRDRARKLPFGKDTLAPVFSVTKAMTALMMARLVDQGRLDYGQTVASVWPEFAQAGKGAITVEQALSHQHGLSGLVEAMEPTEWLDWDGICARLAAMTPLWKPGTASGYSPVTYGYIAGEIFRRVDGRAIADALAEDVAGPLDLDLSIGASEADDHRIADMFKPRELPRFGPLNEAVKAAFLTKWASPAGRNPEEWRRAQIPSTNGHATAPALARLAAILANDGVLDGTAVLSPGMAARAMAERIRGRDLVLPYEISWGAGLMRNVPNMFYGPGPETAGHSGWGGSCLFADPETRVSGGFVTNRQSHWLIGDPRAVELIRAAYAAL
jgi:CubicO group peptidase (beta-lactamase class C family)